MKASRPNRRYQLALWIDRAIGPPLCAALLGFEKLFGRRRPVPPPESVSKILVLKMWGMGSIVLASPLIAKLRARHPEARIDFLSLSENEPILRMVPGVERAISLDLGRGIGVFLVSALRAIWTIRRERYDLLFDLEFFTRFSAIFSYLANPIRSHGFSAKGKWRGRLHHVEVPFNSYHHVALNFLTLLRGDPMEPIDLSEMSGPEVLPRLNPPEGAWRRCLDRLGSDPAWRDGGPVVVVNPNAGDMALERRWPAERVADLLRRLCDRTELTVVTIGSPAEGAYVRSVVEASGAGARIVDAAGRIGISELVALLRHASVVVTNDSGPLHIAAAVGAPTVALFGPETPTLYGPLLSRPGQRHIVHYRRLSCSPCMFVHDNKVLSCWFAQARCMTEIRPADVLASIEELLSGAAETGVDVAGLRAIDS